MAFAVSAETAAKLQRLLAEGPGATGYAGGGSFAARVAGFVLKGSPDKITVWDTGEEAWTDGDSCVLLAADDSSLSDGERYLAVRYGTDPDSDGLSVWVTQGGSGAAEVDVPEQEDLCVKRGSYGAITDIFRITLPDKVKVKVEDCAVITAPSPQTYTNTSDACRTDPLEWPDVLKGYLFGTRNTANAGNNGKYAPLVGRIPIKLYRQPIELITLYDDSPFVDFRQFIQSHKWSGTCTFLGNDGGSYTCTMTVDLRMNCSARKTVYTEADLSRLLPIDYDYGWYDFEHCGPYPSQHSRAYLKIAGPAVAAQSGTGEVTFFGDINIGGCLLASEPLPAPIPFFQISASTSYPGVCGGETPPIPPSTWGVIGSVPNQSYIYFIVNSNGVTL